MNLEYVVIGAGVNGLSAALAHCRRGLKVTLIEQFDIGHSRGSSHGGSRIIRHLYDDDKYTGKVNFLIIIIY